MEDLDGSLAELDVPGSTPGQRDQRDAGTPLHEEQRRGCSFAQVSQVCISPVSGVRRLRVQTSSQGE